MLHITHCNVTQNTLQCYTEHTAMVHGTHCNVTWNILQCYTEHTAMLHGTHCNAARNTLQCYTEHTAMLHRTHCNVLISRDCNYRWCEPKPDAINLQPNPSEIFSWNIIVRAWAHLSQQTCCATYIQKFITLTGAHRLRVLNSRISRVSSVLYNELF